MTDIGRLYSLSKAEIYDLMEARLSHLTDENRQLLAALKSLADLIGTDARYDESVCVMNARWLIAMVEPAP